jgi:tetratricopeptide (TPR) repeat protein
MKQFAILLAALIPLAAVAAMSPEETVSAAERAEKNGAFQQAIDLYLGFLKENPEHIQKPTIAYRLAVCYDTIGKSDPAIKYLKESLAGAADKAVGKHRQDAFMKLARLYADASQHQEAAAALEALLKEGAGLYEDEAQGLRASYLALLGRYDEAAVLFSVLRNKPTADVAKEAAYKLAIVWLKAGSLDLAKGSIEEFVQQYPGDSRVGELFLRLARIYFEKKQFKSAVDVCQQVRNELKDSPEAIEAAFVIGLTYRENGNFEKAIEAFDLAARMPQAAHNTVVASEAFFEAAQIFRKHLNKPDKAADYYHEAAIKSRDPLTARQQTILEQSLFFDAEYNFQQQKWGAAFDLYSQLRKIGSKLNVIERMLYCKSKMSATGDVSMDFESDAELDFIRKRIADNPGTLLALQSEIFLIERKFERALRYGERMPAWSTMSPFIDEYGALLKKYPEAVLRQQNQGAYIRLRMGTVHLYTAEDDPSRSDVSMRGLALCEQALAEAPEALFRVETLETLALLANRCDQNKKAFDAYAQLYAITGRDPQASSRRPPADYLQGLVATADTPDLADEALKTMEKVIAEKPAPHPEAREARFYMAELLYMKQRFVQAAARFREFVNLYGPSQNPDGTVSADWKKPAQPDPAMDQIHEAALRVAHCWRAQGVQSNMVAAYQWMASNLDHLNPRVAEAAYMVLATGVDPAKLPPAKKEELARQLWTRVVNVSLDPGSKAFREGYHPWIRDARATPYVKAAILKAGQFYGDIGRHRLAADLFKEYTVLFNPADKQFMTRDGKSLYPADDQFEVASYASGKEYLLANEYDLAIKQFRVFLDELRSSRFRIPSLMALGHYGTQAEMFQEATDAYAALLDEYGAPNPTDTHGRPVPVAEEKRLRKGGGWNGVRMAPPSKWDTGKVRYGLGYLHWKKEDWMACQTVLAPFLDDPDLRKSPSRAEALFMTARSMLRQRHVTQALKVFEAIMKDHPDFKAIEEVYTDIARSALEVGNWAIVADTLKRFAERFPNSDRRPYMDLYAAAALVGSGQTEAGAGTLRTLAKSDTYEDVKAEAYYHLAMMVLRQAKPDPSGALDLLRKSIASYPDPKALMQAARTACEVKGWPEARECLDRLAREFPKADRVLLDEAQQLRRRIAQEEARR